MAYEGRKDLGEFLLLDLTHSVVADHKMVNVNFRMETLFGFHLLNSFTPSFLICLISYSTFFFSIQDFNERVMVSLTSLLVLAALFTQASDTSVRTPYFKFLDIWYVVLIIFAFTVVIVNIMINGIKVHEKEKFGRLLEEYESSEKDKMDGQETLAWQKKVQRYNLFSRIFFAGFLLIFLTFYGLGATSII